MNRPTLELACGTDDEPDSAGGTLRAIWPKTPVVGSPPAGSDHPIATQRVVRVPDTCCDGTVIGGIDIRAAAVRGLSHRFATGAYGPPRQDFFSFGGSPDGRFAVLAVADGVSGAQHAEIGAETAAQAAVDLALRRLAGADGPAILADGRDLFGDVALEVRSTARLRIGDHYDDHLVATTLLVAVIDTVAEPDDAGRPVWIASVGNSEPLLLVGDSLARPFADGDTALAENTTAWMPEMSASVRAETITVTSGSGLLLVSDGVTETLGVQTVEGYILDNWRQPPGPLELAKSLSFARRGCLDDRVVCGAWL